MGLVLGVGAGDRIRTGDIDLGKVALYQLSYSRNRRDYNCRSGDTKLSNLACKPRADGGLQTGYRRGEARSLTFGSDTVLCKRLKQ